MAVDHKAKSKTRTSTRSSSGVAPPTRAASGPPPRIGHPLAYTGPRLEQRQRVGSCWETNVHDLDQSGEVRYEFNELGFRGPSFDGTRPFLVFVFGESDAFGAGVPFEASWGVLAARLEAKRQGFSPEETMVLNFSESGASNAYIARQVLSQCSALRPDLVLVGLADHDRGEIIDGHDCIAVGPWTLEPHNEVQIEKSDLEESRKALYRRALVRGREFLRFMGTRESEAQFQQVHETLRSVLLIQQALQAAQISSVAIGRDFERIVDLDAQHHPLLGPLVRLLDPSFVSAKSTSTLAGSATGRDEHHLPAAGHQLVAEHVLVMLTTPPSRWPSQSQPKPPPPPESATIAAKVSSFYNDLPFNFHGTDDSAAAAVRHPSVETTYPDLHRYLSDRDSIEVLEVGCGAGWLSHGLNYHYGANVHSIDLCQKAIDRARRLSKPLGTEKHVTFEVCDVFKFQSPERFDLGLSMGALHHTADAKGALACMVSQLRPNGHVYLGLYHKPGRRVFLEAMWRLVETEGEEAAFAAYRELDGIHSADETLARSWFRDQVLHPHETQHTLKEVVGWFDELDLELVTTSINYFGPIKSHKKLFADELKLEAVSKKALFRQRRYYPGFFTACGRLRREPGL